MLVRNLIIITFTNLVGVVFVAYFLVCVIEHTEGKTFS
ncbi:hypothetical protein GEMHA0001_1741 [Gemella haemolysans ATCC 10379]|uniref:Uncharacterized protein n=1 Tax=Gemella haemolysans ATCC 10379 TaxID=546270 RepID=C5NX78_9BACL|nr:hypothetical protein GEMHA0001_1741 [Gemella haemolysans ATCC 10379]